MYPVSLTGSQVTLREFKPDDLDDVHAIVRDHRVTEWLSFDPRDRDQAADMLAGIRDRARLEPRTEYYLAVTLHEDGAVVGFARLALAGVQAGKLGYAIHADHWGHGYATDAVRAIVRFGFDDLKLRRISAAIGPDNLRSITVIAQLGFQYEGRIRHHVYTNGAWRDSLLYSLLADEFRESSPDV